jgi:hypothetical protein
LLEKLAVTYKFPLAEAATPIGFLKLSEVKVNKIFPSLHGVVFLMLKK